MRLSATPLLLLPVVLLSCGKKDPEQPPKATPLTFTTVRTLAGSGTGGYADGPGPAAQFSYPEGVVADAQGNAYVADGDNSCIRKITPAGVVSTLAGIGTGTGGYVDGPAASARFRYVTDVAFDSKGNLFVVDGGNNCIRKITPAGVVSTFAGSPTAGYADGPAASARFSFPNGLAIDAQDVLYVADFDNGSIRKITPAGVVSTLAGNGTPGYADGPGSQARFKGPEGLALDQQGTLYVADFDSYCVRRVSADGTVSTLAGTNTPGTANGPAGSARFRAVTGIAVDASGTVYVADSGNDNIRRIGTDGTVSTLAGTGLTGGANGPVGTAQFAAPSGLALDKSGNLLVTELATGRIRTISAQ